MRTILIILITVLYFHSGIAGGDTSSVFRKRKIILASVTGAGYAGSIVMLNHLWYKDYRTGNFHFFNDNSEWMQMDKYGHAYTTYQIGWAGIQTMRYAGFKEKNAIWIGGSIGSIYMTTIELLDAYSEGWGFSWGDMAANAGGSLLACVQEAVWKEQRIQLKYSFSPSSYTKYRPELLGENFGEQLIKDYNGQSYWLSCNISSFLKKENKFPKWLNLAFGVGADGMTGGHQNAVIVDADGTAHDFIRRRQFYFSLDADLTRIKTKNRLLKKVFRVVNIVKIPFPALQLSGNKVNFTLY